MGRKIDILIVDDNEGFLKGMEMLITNFHSDKVRNIYTSKGGLDCFDVIENHKIDLVFIEYSIPGLNGAEISKILSKNYRYLKIVALTFHQEDVIVESMIYAGAHGYIYKNDLNIDVVGKHINDVRNNYMLI